MDKRNWKKKTVDDTVCEIHKFSGYAVLSNCFVRSTNLGCPAIGLLGRVMDLPLTWIFSKATPHRAGGADAQSDFSSDCIEMTPLGWRPARNFCAR